MEKIEKNKKKRNQTHFLLCNNSIILADKLPNRSTAIEWSVLCRNVRTIPSIFTVYIGPPTSFSELGTYGEIKKSKKSNKVSLYTEIA